MRAASGPKDPAHGGIRPYIPGLVLVHDHGYRLACASRFSRVLAAGPAFFVSAWLLMLFAGVVASDVGIRLDISRRWW